MPVAESTIKLFNEAGAVVLSDVIRSMSDLPVVPVDQITFPEGADFLDNVGVVQFETIEQTDFTTVRVVLLFATEVKLDIPGLEGFALVLGSTADGGSEITLEFDLAPNYFEFRIVGNVAFRFARNILKPVVQGSNGWEEVPDKYTEIRIDGTLRVDGDGDVAVDGPDAFDLPPSMIGDTGVIIEAEDIVLILSRKTALPPAAPPEIVPGWRGVFIDRAAIYLPEAINVPVENLVFENCYVGSGGFTGEALTSWTIDPPSGDVFGAAFSLTRIHLGFRQNTLTESAIRGTINLPFFDEAVDVEIAINVNGNFSVSLASETGLYTLTKPGILKLELTGLGFEAKNGHFLVKLSGTIKLLYGGLDWPEVEVRELSIDQDGHIHIEGGWLDLPKSKLVDFNGFIMELTKIGFGNAGDRKWIGFSGGIRLVDELAFGASVEGLKILWNSAGNVDLQMSSIRVELTIPDVLKFDGFVEYFEQDGTKGFKGDISLTIDALKGTSFDASLIVGKNKQTPPYNFFYILINAELPAGIPLGQSNLAIYGFSALMGNNMAPTRTADQEWFQWYMLPPIGTTDRDKWAPLRGSQALGAGITLGTASDDGFAFSAKTILIVLLPGPLLLIDGKANMLKPRKELAGNTQGDHRALAVLDQRAGTFLINIQPRFKYDQFKGAMLDVIGAAEGFFDFNRPEAWHLYLGEDEPLEKRIRAKILKGLLKADSYLMLDQQGMRFGARTGFDEDYKFGPLAVALKAQIEGEAQVSWRPIQADGTLTLEGLAGLSAFGCKSSASINARLEVQAPWPYYVYGDFRVKLKTPWPLRDPSARVKLKWGNPDDEPERVETVARVAAEHLKVNESWNLEKRPQPLDPPQAWDLEKSTRPLDPQGVPSGLPIIPLDAKVLINFNRPVADRALVACNATPSPPRERVGQMEVLHELVGLELSRAQDSGWTVVEQRTEGDGELFGMWLPIAGGDKAAGKLQLWSGSPFTYGRNSGRSYFDWFLAQAPAYPCPPKEPTEEVCMDFERTEQGPRPALFVVDDLIFEYLFPQAPMRPQVVYHPSTLTGTKQALLLPNPVSDSVKGRVPLRITLPEPASEVRVFANSDRPMICRGFRDGQEVAIKEWPNPGEVELVLEADGIEYVELALSGSRPRGKIWLLRVCSTAQSDRDRADEVDLVRSHLKKEMTANTARWCGGGHLFEPDSLYQLKISTQVRKWRDGDGPETLGPTDDFVYFRTAGPPGFFATESPLRELTPYLNSRASTPENGAQPVYRGYDMRLVFNENYLERMYDGNDHPLSVSLLDRNGQPAGDERGLPVSITTEWLRDPYAVAARSDQLWLWALNREEVAQNGCEPAGDMATCIEPNNILEARLRERPLAPRTLIEARVIAAGRYEPVYRRSFTTSRFVSFVHHVHSFEDFAWDHHRLREEPTNPLLTPDELARLDEIVTTKRDADPGFDAATEGTMFDEMAALFKLGHRSLPERVEITLLRDGSRSYALLLESPEPIEWARTNLTVRRSADSGLLQTRATGSVKIIGVSLSPPVTNETAYNSEWVDLLVQTDTNMSGFAIEHTGGEADTTPLTKYYEFADEPVMAAGTIIRVHAGTQATDSTPAPECLHRYATPSDEEGRWRLNAAGDTLRLVDARNRELQRWSVIRAALFQPLTPVVVRTADQTRALIFFPESEEIAVGSVPEGRIRLEWHFLRDIGPIAPVLTRGGRNDPEDAVLELSLPASWP